MRKLLLFLAFILASAICRAKSNDSTLYYPVVVKFQSMCCGVPSDEPLQKMIHVFKRKYHVKSITAFQIGPLGREGEYILGFSLSELNKKRKQKFISKLKATTILMKDKGYAELELNYSVSTSSLSSRATIEKLNF
jgi:hypothetical protein